MIQGKAVIGDGWRVGRLAFQSAYQAVGVTVPVTIESAYPSRPGQPLPRCLTIRERD